MGSWEVVEGRPSAFSPDGLRLRALIRKNGRIQGVQSPLDTLMQRTQSSSSKELSSLSRPLFVPTDSSPTTFFSREGSSPPGLPRTLRNYRGEKTALAVIVADKDINYMGLDDFPFPL